jgi:hypothetical protein
MSPNYRVPPFSPKDIDSAENSFHKPPTDHHSQTSRHQGPLGKHHYSLAYGASGLSKLLLYNDAGNGSLDPLDGMIKKSMNPEDNRSKGDIIVPRDFMIKTAYVRKRRNTQSDVLSVRSKQSSAISVFTKHSQPSSRQ